MLDRVRVGFRRGLMVGGFLLTRNRGFETRALICWRPHVARGPYGQSRLLEPGGRAVE